MPNPPNLPDMIVAGPGICLFTLKALASEVSLSEEDTEYGLQQLNELAAASHPEWPSPAIPLLPLWGRRWFSLVSLPAVLHSLTTPPVPLTALPTWTQCLQDHRRGSLRLSLNSLADAFFQKRNTDQRRKRRASPSKAS